MFARVTLDTLGGDGSNQSKQIGVLRLELVVQRSLIARQLLDRLGARQLLARRSFAMISASARVNSSAVRVSATERTVCSAAHSCTNHENSKNTMRGSIACQDCRNEGLHNRHASSKVRDNLG